MRVFVDTNTLIGYLLNSSRSSAASSALRAGIQGVFDMVISREILDELMRSIVEKSYLRSRISESDLMTFLNLVTSTSEVLDAIDAATFDLSRDSDDNFVLLQAIAADVDFILTGDQDLLVLNVIGHIRIVNAYDLLGILEEAAK